MNKQSNTYTIIYTAVLVVIVGAVLALTYMALKPRQTENAANDKRMQILSSVHKAASGDMRATYEKYITASYIVNNKGERLEGDAFAVTMAAEVKKDADSRQLPVFECTLDDGSTKYILPVYGAGLWGPIWGYVAVDDDGSTVYGTYFSHESETPGLGAEIAKSAFQDQFEGKELYKDGTFRSVYVMKAGQKPQDSQADYVDAISGGTVTSKGVESMLKSCLTDYDAFLSGLNK